MYLIEFPLSKVTNEVALLSETSLHCIGDNEFSRGATAALEWMTVGGLSPSQTLIKSKGLAHVG